MPRIRGHRPDRTHDEVVKALRAVGVSVVPLVSTGGGGWERTGLPDLLIGVRGETWLMEVKGEDGKLRKSQLDWARQWRGAPPIVVRSAHEALSALGIIVERAEKYEAAGGKETRPAHGNVVRARSRQFMERSLAERGRDAVAPEEHERDPEYDHDE